MQTREASAPLSGWVTFDNVRDALGIKHNTVRQAVHRALLDHQDWVKRELYPNPHGPLRWLIDTNHVMYLCHERRWRKLTAKTRSEQIPTTHDGAVHRREYDTTHCCCPPGSWQPSVDGPQTWSELCQWLAKQGLVVFVNAVANDQSWQWSWMGRARSGYLDATAAITAALQYHLTEHHHCLSPMNAAIPLCHGTR